MAELAHYKCSRSKVKVRITAQRNVSAVKRYKTATDRLSDFKLGMDVVIKSDRDWRDVGLPSSCHAFAIVTLLVGFFSSAM